MMDAQEKRGLTDLFITHDLSVVAHISTQVAVIYLGTLCEMSLTAELFGSPRHPYTRHYYLPFRNWAAKNKDIIRLEGDVHPYSILPPVRFPCPLPIYR